ncbi:MAG TPA: hypothetical protein VGW30_08930 [Gaiellaceae bacterium]|nr:hypothetical protein [Gaiellaceae bacterium]
MRPRWDIDERGHGVGDARRLLPEARALLERMDTPFWVTEDADAQLLSHIRATHGHTLLLRVTP